MSQTSVMLKAEVDFRESQGVTDRIRLRTHGDYPDDPHVVLSVKGAKVTVRQSELLAAVKAVCRGG